MNKIITISKQKITVECDDDEVEFINQAEHALNHSIDKIIRNVPCYDRAVLMSALEIIVEQFKRTKKIEQQESKAQEALNDYQHACQSLSKKIHSIL